MNKIESRHEGFYVAELGSVTHREGLPGGDQRHARKAGMIAPARTRSCCSCSAPPLRPWCRCSSRSRPSRDERRSRCRAGFIPVDEQIAEVILLVGLAVGVDYSLFYLRARALPPVGERAAFEAAAATSGRAVLVSGITVLIAMAGMLFSGDKTFMSFSIRTMMVARSR